VVSTANSQTNKSILSPVWLLPSRLNRLTPRNPSFAYWLLSRPRNQKAKQNYNNPEVVSKDEEENKDRNGIQPVLQENQMTELCWLVNIPSDSATLCLTV